MPVGRLVANCLTPYRRLPAQKTPGWSDPTKATFQNSSRAPPTSLESPQSKSSGLGPSFGGLTRREGSSKIFPQKRTPSRKTKFAFATLSPYPCFTLAVHHARKEQDLGQMSHRNFSVVAAQSHSDSTFLHGILVFAPLHWPVRTLSAQTARSAARVRTGGLFTGRHPPRDTPTCRDHGTTTLCKAASVTAATKKLVWKKINVKTLGPKP